MDARRGVGAARRGGDPAAEAAARAAVDDAKRRLGERGPVWWTDGAPDLGRHMAVNTPYAAWFTTLAAGSCGDAAATNESAPAAVDPRGAAEAPHG